MGCSSGLIFWRRGEGLWLLDSWRRGVTAVPSLPVGVWAEVGGRFLTTPAAASIV